jgi:uncharacterized protein (TIGR02246 family)
MPSVGYAEQASDTKAFVQKVADDWMNAYNKGDAATIAQMYADDGLVSFSQWTVSGRGAIQEAFTKEFGAGVKFSSIMVDQSKRAGDLMYAQGTWAAEAKGPDGKTMPLSGHWLSVSKCQGENCQMMIHNGNTAMPPPK